MKWSSDNFYLYFQINLNKCVLSLTNYTAVQFRLVEKLLFAKRVKDDDWGPKTHDTFINWAVTSNSSFFWTLVVLGAAFHVTLFLAFSIHGKTSKLLSDLVQLLHTGATGSGNRAPLKCSVSRAPLGAADLTSAAASSKEKTGLLCNFILQHVKPQLQILFKKKKKASAIWYAWTAALYCRFISQSSFEGILVTKKICQIRMVIIVRWFHQVLKQCV